MLSGKAALLDFQGSESNLGVLITKQSHKERHLSAKLNGKCDFQAPEEAVKGGMTLTYFALKERERAGKRLL